MIQGISSNTGKSIFVTGLCRMLFHRGVKVCPFKPQNISLNSYITDSGDEIGYAQYIQAYASGIKAERYMNPVLIKISDKETQFVLNGEVRYIGNFSDYKKMLPKIQEAIVNSLNKLKREYDLVIIEGAGSPAEINCSSIDISNMWTAKLSDSPVILIANMELGGAFASVAGTIELLDEKYRKLIKGYLFNKYSGHVSILEKGTKILYNKYGKDFLGAIPYIPNIGIPDEDFGDYTKQYTNQTSDFNLDECLDKLSQVIENNIDVDKMLKLLNI